MDLKKAASLISDLYTNASKTPVTNNSITYQYDTRNNLMKAFRTDSDTPIKCGKKAVIVGGGAFGIWGILFAVPLAATAYRLLRSTNS